MAKIRLWRGAVVCDARSTVDAYRDPGQQFVSPEGEQECEGCPGIRFFARADRHVRRTREPGVTVDFGPHLAAHSL